MTDKVSKEKRSEIMSKIKSKNTKPELLFKEIVEPLPYSFVWHPPADFHPEAIVVPKRTAIFIDGTFWHGYERMPFISGEFWVNKILRNMQRDEEANMHYSSHGWCVIRITDKAISKIPPNTLRAYLSAVLAPDTRVPGVRHIG